MPLQGLYNALQHVPQPTGANQGSNTKDHAQKFHLHCASKKKIESTQAGLLGPVREVAPCACDNKFDIPNDVACQTGPQEAY
jgi:hypothetical protein